METTLFLMAIMIAEQLKQYISSTKTWIINYIAVQTILLAVSAPFLIAWGIPFSVASIVGNLLFTPFIFIFLFISSLFFICTVSGYTPTLLIFLLETISRWWVWVLALGSDSWMVHIPYSSSILLGIYIFCLVYASVTTQWHYLYKKPERIMGAISIFMLCFLLSNIFLHTQNQHIIDKKLLLHPTEQQGIKIYDAGFLSKPGSVNSTVHYDLQHQLTQLYGSPIIDEYISNRLNKKTCLGLAELCSIVQIKKIILPPLKQMPKDFWRAYYHLKRTAEKHNTTIMHSRYSCKTVSNMFGFSPAQKTRYTALQNGMFV